MYKKIKNGSFMNLIWFILATLPFVLLLIYSSQYLLDKNVNTYNNINNYMQEEYCSTYNNLNFVENNNYTFKVNDTNEYSELDFLNINMPNGTYYLYFYTDYELEYMQIDIGNNNITWENFTGYKTYTFEYTTNLASDIIIINSNNNQLTIKFFLSTIEMTEQEFLELNNYKYIKVYNNNLKVFLNDLNETLKTNGFISNTFLNLSQFFGVTNVYYSLACYYIEYLLIIILLHLAFDLIYIVPNICHKFMEKIGGERD